MSSLYKYVSIERLRGILSEYRIRFTQPGAFNDPFELVPLLLVPNGIAPQGYRTYKFDLNAPRRSDAAINARVGVDRCSDHHSRDLRESLNREVGFLSLSRTWNSLPMWGHYADSYSGAVIEFDGDHEFFSSAFEILYSSHRPIRDWRSYSRAPIPISEMCEKSVEWDFEQEVRVARVLSDCQLIPDCQSSRQIPDFPVFVADIPRECIKRVILGERSDDSVEVCRLIGENSEIRVDQAVINHWDYNLELRPIFRAPRSGKEVGLFAVRNYRDFPRL